MTDTESSPFEPLYPSLQLFLVALFLASYCMFFTFVVAQISLTCYMRNRMLSYHTIFLMLGMLWTLLRIVMFVLLLKTEIKYPLLDWPLRCGPVILNFVMLTLFTLCFVQVLIESSRSIVMASTGHAPPISYKTKKMAYCAYSLMLSLFLSVNVVSFVLQMRHSSKLWAVVQLSLQEGCMILSCIFLSVTLYFVSEGGPVVQGMIEREGKSIKQVLWSGGILIFTYVSHSVYCIYCVATSKYESGREVYVNDMVLNNTLSKRDLAPISIALILWDFVPVIIMLHFFKTKNPPSDSDQVTQDYNGCMEQNFFTNPSRYDEYSDDNQLLSDRGTEYSGSPSVITYGSLDSDSPYHHLSPSDSPYRHLSPTSDSRQVSSASPLRHFNITPQSRSYS